jgi:hypothetical protein
MSATATITTFFIIKSCHKSKKRATAFTADVITYMTEDQAEAMKDKLVIADPGSDYWIDIDVDVDILFL